MSISYTRGFGLLEKFLTKKRAKRANRLILKISRQGRLLDIGCGFKPYFLSQAKFKVKYGIDPSLAESTQNKDIHLLKLDVAKKKLPFKDNFFDVITMLAVFEHIDNQKLKFVLKEALRILKKEGKLIITTPSPWSDKILHVIARLGLISRIEIDEHKHNHSGKKITDILIDAGFKKEKIRRGFFELFMNMWFTAGK